jgi:hypothetical protein
MLQYVNPKKLLHDLLTNQAVHILDPSARTANFGLGLAYRSQKANTHSPLCCAFLPISAGQISMDIFHAVLEKNLARGGRADGVHRSG